MEICEFWLFWKLKLESKLNGGGDCIIIEGMLVLVIKWLIMRDRFNVKVFLGVMRYNLWVNDCKREYLCSFMN